MAEDFDKLMSIFQDALEKHAPESWDQFVREACEGNEALYRQVCRLLESHAHGGSLLDKPVVAAPPTAHQTITEKQGTVVGPYKLQEKIGDGGFGVVYMADQTEPVKRRVALKIIKPGMDTRQVIGRFEAERQALAMMDHPNIAKVLDAGTTNSGRPYFVMELVKGVPITEYCDEHHLTPRERLGLFVPVCQAVQHAHQKGVIHRDIKPSNVLVAEYDDRAVPKVIDFGVAKAVDQRLTEKTVDTHFGQVVGTIDYMSPEQAKLNQLDVDTRSDIYSLGVLLYELLTGATPFDPERLRLAAFDELLRIIREEDPPRPSARLSTSDTLPSIAANRRIEPKKLSTLVRGELDWIVMKALEKDRSRRYETATSFSADVERYLSDEPVTACPPSAAYRFKKFARRNKTALVTSVVVAVSLLAGTGVATWQAIRATRESRRAVAAEGLASEQARRANEESERAKTEAAIAQAVNDFINNDLLAKASPANEPDRDIKLRTVLDRAAERIQGRFTDQPLVEAAIRHTLGATYFELGEYQKAEQQNQRALDIRLRELGPDHADTLWSMNNLANAVSNQGQWAEAEKLYRKAIEGRRRALGEEHPDTLGSMNGLALTIGDQGQYAESEKLFSELIEIQRRVCGPEHLDTLKSMNNLALAIRYQERHAEAEKLHRQVLEAERRILGPEHPFVLGSATNLATAIAGQGRHAEAEKLYGDLLDLARRVLGREHPDTLSVHVLLATTLRGQGRHDECEKVNREVLKTQRRVQGPDHPHTVATMHNLGGVLRDQGRLAEAEEILREVLTLRECVFGREHPKTLDTMHQLGHVVQDQGRHAEAEKIFGEELAPRQGGAGPENPQRLCAMRELARAISSQGRHDEAIAVCRDLIELAPDSADSYGRLGDVLAKKGELDAAIAEYRKAVELAPDDPIHHAYLADALRDKREFEAAMAEYRKVLELAPDSAAVQFNLAWVLERRGDLDLAVAEFQKAVELDPDGADVHSAFGWTLKRKGDLGAAVAEFRKAIELDPLHRYAHENLASTAEQLGDLDTALAERRRTIELYRQSLAKRRDSADVQAFLGSDLRELGNFLRKSGKPGEAESAYREAAEVFQTLMTAFPEKPEYRLELNNSLRNLSAALKEQNQYEEAVGVSQRVYDGQRQLLDDYPDNRWYLRQMLWTARIHADSLQGAGRLEEAVEMRRYVVDVNLQLIGEPPGVREYRERLASNYLDLVAALSKVGRAEEMEQPLREAVAAQEKLIEDFPNKEPYRDTLGRCFWELGAALRAKKECCAEALTYLQKAVEVAPDASWSHHHLADFRLNVADETFRSPDQAAEHAARAVELNPSEPGHYRWLGQAAYQTKEWSMAAQSLEKILELGKPAEVALCFQLAICHGHLGDKEKAADWHAKGVTLMEKENPDHPPFRAWRAQAEQVLGLETTETTED